MPIYEIKGQRFEADRELSISDLEHLSSQITESPKEDSSEFGNTARSTGAHMVNAFLGQPIEDIGAAVGSEKVAEFGKGVRERAEQIQKENPSSIGSLKDIGEHPIDAAEAAAGNVLPQLPVSLASSWAGAEAGAALGSVVPGAGTAIGAVIGGALGLLAPSYMQEYAEMRGKQHEGGKEDIPKALLTALPAAALDAISDKILLGGSKLLPSSLRSAVNAEIRETGAALMEGAAPIKGGAIETALNVVKQGAVGGGIEGATEYAQTGLEQVGGNQDISTPEASQEREVSAALGAIGGGGVKGISALAPTTTTEDIAPEQPAVEPVQPTQPQGFSERDRKVDMENGLELAGVNPDDHPELYAELSDPRHYQSEETINALDERLQRYKSDEAPVEGEEEIDFAKALPKEFDDTAWEAHLEKQREYARQAAPAAEQPQAENVEPEVAESETNEYGEPPVPEGMTRLYHGSATHDRVDGPAWFSTNRDYAKNYREGAQLQYVDYPTDKVNESLDPNGYGQTVDKGFTWNVELDSDETGVRNIVNPPKTSEEQPEPKPSVSTSDTLTEHNIESLQPHLTPEMKRLVASGKLTLHDSMDTLPGEGHPENVQGLTTPQGEVHLVANKLTPETLPKVAMHEMGVHVGMRGMVGDKVWGDLTSQALTTKGEAFDRARQAVPENTPEHLKGEETLAYLVENAPKLPVVKRAISAVKNWARTTFGAKLDLTEADAHHLAAKALRRESQTTTRAPREETAFSVAPNSKLQEQVEKDRQGMRPAAVKQKKTLKERFSKSGENLQHAADVYETRFFSHDAGFVNAVRRSLEKMKLDPNLIGKLLDRVSQAQTVSDSSISAEGALCGSLEYDTNTDFFVAVNKADNLVTMRQIIDDAGTEYGWSEEETHKFFTSYMVAGRLKEKYEKARALKVEANKQTTPAAKAALFKQSREITDTLKLGMTEEECDAAREAYKSVDGFVKAEKMWHKVRENTIDVLVKSGLYSKEKAETYMDAAFYTPMYRVMTDKTTSDEIESTFDDMSSGKYKPNISSLIKGMKEQKFKGSNREVFNMMDNMEHWVQISFSRAVRAKKATDMIDTARRYLPEGAVTRVQGTKSNKDDTITCYFHGKKQYWRFDDPLMAVAFRGVPAAPFALKSIGKVSDIMRKGIVLTPTFTLSQLPQDIYDAAFSSGIKNPFKLLTTMLSEFRTTAFSKEDTEAHKALKAIGAVGAKDSLGDSRTLHLYDTVHHTHLSKDKTAWRKFVSSLEKFAMAGDNAIRQAVYVRTMKELEGDPRAKSIAYQRAFDIINFRRRGAWALLEQVRSVTPFMGAAMQAHRAAYQVIAGRGLAYQSSADSKSAHMRLATTSTTMALMAFVYNMLYGGLLGDDDDKDKFNKEDTRFKDTHIMLFGGSSMVSIPLRPSVFSLPYITGNHLFQLGVAESENPRQTADAYREAIISAFGIPILPPVIREGFQQATNYDFFTNRPIVPERLRKNDPSYQYDDRTSALGKLVGEVTSGLPKEAQLSPIKFDHFMKGWFSGVGTATLQLSNLVEVAASDNPSKEHTFREMVRMLPSVPGLVPEEFKEQSKSTYYDLREEVEGAHSTYNRLKKEGKLEDARKYKESHKNLLNESVHQKMNHLKTETDKIHATTRKILSNKNLSSEIKAERVRALEAKERRLLSHIQTLYDKVH